MAAPPLFWQLCKEGKVAEVREALLREEGLNSKGEGGVNSKDEYATTGLMWAVMNKHNSIVRLLLENPKVDLNCTDNNGRAALQHSIIVDNFEGVQLLLSNPRHKMANHVDDVGLTPVMLAKEFKNMNALRMLVVHRSATKKNKKMMQATIEESERKLEDLRIESVILEEAYEQEHKEMEMRLKKENEKLRTHFTNQLKLKKEKTARYFESQPAGDDLVLL